MSDSLCFSCPLPDCDETSPSCLLNAACRQYKRAQRRGRLDTVPADVRAAQQDRIDIWRIERLARLSEEASS